MCSIKVSCTLFSSLFFEHDAKRTTRGNVTLKVQSPARKCRCSPSGFPFIHVPSTFRNPPTPSSKTRVLSARRWSQILFMITPTNNNIENEAASNCAITPRLSIPPRNCSNRSPCIWTSTCAHSRESRINVQNKKLFDAEADITRYQITWMRKRSSMLAKLWSLKSFHHIRPAASILIVLIHIYSSFVFDQARFRLFAKNCPRLGVAQIAAK